MAEIVLDTPFGRVTLACAQGTPGAIARPAADLPEGMRVDGCLRGLLHLGVTEGDRVALTLSARLSGGSASHARAEMREAWEVEAPGLSGAYGMPDAEWLEGRFGLKGTGFSEGSTGITLYLQATRPVVADIPVAAAWTTDPASEEERLSPWFAAGQALDGP